MGVVSLVENKRNLKATVISEKVKWMSESSKVLVAYTLCCLLMPRVV